VWTSCGKNLVGAIHAPRFTLADIETLTTLPRNQIAAGCAEAIKHGVIADAAYADDLGRAAAACLAVRSLRSSRSWRAASGSERNVASDVLEHGAARC